MHLSCCVDLWRWSKHASACSFQPRPASESIPIEDMKEDVALYVANGYLQAVFNREAVSIETAQLELTRAEYHAQKNKCKQEFYLRVIFLRWRRF